MGTNGLLFRLQRRLLLAAGTPATPEARYPIASVTKLYTAAVVMRSEERGDLRLADRMVDLLPTEVTRGLHVLDGVDRTGEITVEHLLGHTSGLADYYEDAPSGRPSAQDRLLAGEDAPMPFEEVLRVVRDELKPHFPPQPLGAAKPKAHYADTNFQLLGAVIEQITGQPLHLVFNEMLFGPLGLDATSSYPHPPRSGASAEPEAHIWAKETVLDPRGALRHRARRHPLRRARRGGGTGSARRAGHGRGAGRNLSFRTTKRRGAKESEQMADIVNPAPVTEAQGGISLVTEVPGPNSRALAARRDAAAPS